MVHAMTVSTCCDRPLVSATGWAPAPDATIKVCARCGQVYRPDGKPEGRWRFPRFDQHGRVVKPLRPLPAPGHLT